MSRVFASVTVLGITLAAASSCADTASCDPNQDLIDGNCITKAPAVVPKPDAGACGEAGADAGDAGDACAPPTSTCDDDKLDAPCSDNVNHSECGCDAPYCAVQPGKPGYCTPKGCDEDPTICPDGWTCFDVSVFMAGEPWICSKPAN